MSPRFARSTGFAVVAVVASLITGSAAVVYDNTNPNNVLTSAFRTGLEYGDEIKLAGVERFVTEFLAGYFGDFPDGPAPTGRVRFYANDGTDAIPGSQVALRPKTVIWESGPFSLGRNNQEIVLQPNVTVPDSFTWTIQFDGLNDVVGNGAALSVVNPVTVGGELSNGSIGSFNDFWIKNGSTEDSWALNVLSGGTVPANFYARVTAVPEPGSLVLASLGILALLARAGIRTLKSGVQR
jgi:hypothetical protein